MTWFPWELRVTSDRTTVLMPRNYSPRRIQEVIGQYGVTHFLWGSFEPPPYHEINPESWARGAGTAPRRDRADRGSGAVPIVPIQLLPGPPLSSAVSDDRACPSGRSPSFLDAGASRR